MFHRESKFYSEICSNDVWFILLFFGKHLIVNLTQALSKCLSELPACYHGEVDQSARVNTMSHGKLLSTGHGFGFSKHLLYFFWILCFYFLAVLYHCRVQCHSRKESGLETNLNPTMTMLLFSSILSTKRQWPKIIRAVMNRELERGIRSVYSTILNNVRKNSRSIGDDTFSNYLHNQITIRISARRHIKCLHVHFTNKWSG